MHCKSLWIKASAKCINVNVNVNVNDLDSTTLSLIHTHVLWLHLYVCSSESAHSSFVMSHLITHLQFIQGLSLQSELLADVP